MAQIVGIGGVSRSGKSTLAQRLKKKLATSKVFLLDMDDYVFEEKKVPHIKGHPDWEVPESIDYERILTTINDRASDYEVIIIEGILAFANEALTSRYDVTVLMEISRDTYFERRKQETRWGKDPDWYLEYVWESYKKYGQYPEADFILSGETTLTDADLTLIIQKIRTTPS